MCHTGDISTESKLVPDSWCCRIAMSMLCRFRHSLSFSSLGELVELVADFGLVTADPGGEMNTESRESSVTIETKMVNLNP